MLLQGTLLLQLPSDPHANTRIHHDVTAEHV